MNGENKCMKIAFLTSFDPRDRRSWSGTFYHMAQALQKHCGDVSYIGPIHTVEEFGGKILNKSLQFLIKKRYPYYISFLLAQKYAKVAAQRLARRSFDLIIAPAGVTTTAFLKTDIPIVLVEDATLALLHNYHAQYSNLLDRSIFEAHVITQSAMNKASLLVFSSTWAARSAVEDYHIDEGKVHCVPFGANFEDIPPKEMALAKKKSERCKLLFVGVNWRGKGGDIAFETLVKLEEMGIQAELIVCGCAPPNIFSHKRMTVIPFLDKNDEQQRSELQKLYALSDFLLLPTRYDCTPIVFCEAMAFGLPIIATHTGGVPEVVKAGENGFLLSYGAGGTEYAEVIARIYRDDQRYSELVRSSRSAFEERLNWDAWGTAMKRLIVEQLTAGRSTAATLRSNETVVGVSSR